MNLFSEFVSKTIDYILTGKIHVLEDVSVGLESIPSAFVGLFRGDNVGKFVMIKDTSHLVFMAYVCTSCRCDVSYITSLGDIQWVFWLKLAITLIVRVLKNVFTN